MLYTKIYITNEDNNIIQVWLFNEGRLTFVIHFVYLHQDVMFQGDICLFVGASKITPKVIFLICIMWA